MKIIIDLKERRLTVRLKYLLEMFQNEYKETNGFDPITIVDDETPQERSLEPYDLLRVLRYVQEQEVSLLEINGPCVVDECVLYYLHKGKCFDLNGAIS